jgi:methyl-accepting chemotaxis protein
MKVNMPITNREVELKDTASIVSTTDLKGVITSVNREFIEISGFTERELLGHSHNIVRHPDMPAAAFADLWQTVKAGKPWTGMVKNRCKNGDYYWVEANVTPLREAGHVVGYMSVRNRPTREQIQQAQAVYRAINEGRTPKTGLTRMMRTKMQNLPMHLKLQSVQAVPILAMLLSVAALQNGMQGLAMGLMGGGALLGALLAVLVSRSVVGPIRQATQALKTMSEGNLNVKFDISRDDEIGQLMQALRTVQIRIGHDINETRKLADESTRVRMALDTASTNVMIADNDRNIVYMNPAVTAMMKNAEADLRKVFPNFDANRLLGSNMDQFHKNPAHQQRLLAEFTGTHKAEIAIGIRTFGLTANPVFDRNGQRLGSVVEWADLTAEKMFDKQIYETIKGAVEGNLSVRIKADPAMPDGVLKKTGEGINMILDAVVGPLTVAADYVKRIAEGDIPPKITEKYKGDFTTLKDNLNTCIDAVNALIGDAALLSRAAVEGRLETRADAEQHRGDFRKIVQGVNDTLDAVIGPLTVAAGYVYRISKGDIPAKITDHYNGDFNTLKENLNTCIEAIQALVADAHMLSQAAQEGRVQTRADATRHQGDFQKIVEGVNATLETIVGPIVVVKHAAEAINLAAKEISAGNTDLSQRTEEQASSLEQTAASMEELASTVKQNADNARHANQMTVAASDVAARGGAVVQQVVDTMRDINESSRKIVDIISVIDGIAFQTNILALNAAVEAARAGEQGRGFAVVAGEVRNLAQRSAAAAKEIKALISNSVEKVEDGSQLVDEAGKTMDEIVTSVRRVADIMSEIAAASMEQSAGIEQVNQAIVQMDEVTQRNAALVEQAAAAAESLEEEAAHLVQSVSRFRLDAETGMRTVTQQPASRTTERRAGFSASTSAAKPGAPKPRPAKVPLPQTEGGEDEWSEF